MPRRLISASLIDKHDLMDAENLFIDDLREISEPTPLESDLMALGNIRGLALVHLRSQNQSVGCFFVAYHNPRRVLRR